MLSENAKLLPLLVVLLVLFLSTCGAEDKLPPTVHPPAVLLPRSMKGYELYSWRVGREWFFTLVTGTNRPKTYQEVALDTNTVEENWVKVTVRGTPDLEATLDQLPPDTQVAWHGPRVLKQSGLRPGDLAFPPREVIEDIETHCHELGIQLAISR